MSDLKPCPFCGATPLLYDLLETHGVFSVECPTFGCDADSTKHTKDEAIKAWNRRAQSSNQSTVEVGTTVQAGQVPMTDAQITHALRSEPMADNEESFALGIRAAERHHGIAGEKGGA